MKGATEMSSLSMSQASINAVVIDGDDNMTTMAVRLTNALLLRSRKWFTWQAVIGNLGMLKYHGLAR